MKSCTILRRQNGSSAVEAAIILSFFMLIVFGIVEWSLYLYNDHIITDASRRGARRGIVQASPKISEGEIQATVLSYTGDNLVTFGTQTPPSVAVKNLSDPTMASPIRCTKFGDDLQVAVSYDYQFLLLPAFTFGRVSPSKTITARTIMKCE